MTSQINIQHLLWMWCTLLLIAILVYDLLHRHFDVISVWLQGLLLYIFADNTVLRQLLGEEEKISQ